MKQKLIFFFVLLLSAQAVLAQIKEFSITCDPANFQTIYDNYDQDIYIPATFEYDGTVWPNVSIRIRGDGSRVYPKKSLKVRFNQGQYVDGRASLNLNAEWEDQSYIQQFLASRLMKESGQACFTTEHVRLKLNGTFFGLYLLIEAVDERFLNVRGIDTLGATYKAALDGSSLSIFDEPLYHWEQKTGNDVSMVDLQQLIDGLNSEPQGSFPDFVDEHFNREELVNVLAMKTLLALGSTYYHNYFMYHEPTTNKWSMLPWDMDKTLSYYGSGLPYHRSSTYWTPDNPVLEKSVQSDQLLQEILLRVEELEATIFNVSYIQPIIDSLQTAISASVIDDTSDDVTDIPFWEGKVANYLNQFAQRVSKLQTQVNELPKSFTVERIGSAEPGSTITLHWTPSVSPLTRPISYKFSMGSGLGQNDAIDIENITDTLVQITMPAVEGSYYYKVQSYDGFNIVDGFDTYNPIIITSDVPSLVINEINYNSATDFDPNDWVEIYNPLSYSVDLEGWQLKDSQNDNSFTFGAGTTIQADEFLVVTRDEFSFQSLYPEVGNVAGSFAFGLSNSGDGVRLYHSSGLLVDEVHFLDQLPWPEQADGLGPTLELNSPELDNSLATNWTAWENKFGTPGEHNFQGLGINDQSVDDLYFIYPNPTQDGHVHVLITENNAGVGEVIVRDVYGRFISRLAFSWRAGTSVAKLDLKLPASGVYPVEFRSESTSRTFNLIFTNSNY
jgi:spore coat protein H